MAMYFLLILIVIVIWILIIHGVMTFFFPQVLERAGERKSQAQVDKLSTEDLRSICDPILAHDPSGLLNSRLALAKKGISIHDCPYLSTLIKMEVTEEWKDHFEEKARQLVGPTLWNRCTAPSPRPDVPQSSQQGLGPEFVFQPVKVAE
ncbi:hypothetical protein PAPYR_4411 [Paratrimastix pyriformis]|uniref:Uncharacterized protein n=1 Tax=Paratrimastix pyriformis TaxID=342808 RepID=A0ABQ8UNR3_9EUKA|nr:hypothetical protein PAPYR_4411 [Paratrimastix pyriformis]